MSFRTWVDQQVADAEARGVFDDLPGAGKPLELSDDGDFTDKWVRDYVRRSGESFEDALPAPLRLRKEAERLAQGAEKAPSESELRAAVKDLNRRIMDWRRLPVGPPVYVKLVDEEQLVAAWRAARERVARELAAAARQAAAARAGGSGRPRWRSLRRRRALRRHHRVIECRFCVRGEATGGGR
jgi:hypothetical protein